MKDLEQLIAQAELGEEAKKFLDGDLGKKLIDLADDERRVALEDLANVNPKDEAKIIELQLNARFGEKFGAWLVSLVREGENAITVYRQQRGD